MGYFNRDNNRSGGKRFGNKDFGRKKFGRNDFGNGQGRAFMHKATCAECGKEAEVPFKPAPGRSVFCSECFEKRGNSNPRRENNLQGRFERAPEFTSRPSFEKGNNPGNDLKQFEILNSKLDKILSALTALEKPVENLNFTETVPPKKEVKKIKKEKAPVNKSKVLKKKKIKA